MRTGVLSFGAGRYITLEVNSGDSLDLVNLWRWSIVVLSGGDGESLSIT